MPDAYADELSIGQKKTATGPAMFGDFLRDQDATRVAAVVNLECGRLDKFGSPARQLASIIDPD